MEEDWNQGINEEALVRLEKMVIQLNSDRAYEEGWMDFPHIVGLLYPLV